MAKDHPTGKSGLYAAFLELETPEECYRFLQDVCSYAELSAMEQRYNIAEKLRGFHERAPRAAGNYLRHGAAGIYVDNVGLKTLGYLHCALHELRLVPEKLHRHRALPGSDRKQLGGLSVVVAQALAACHLADNIAGSVFLRHDTVRPVGYARHRSKRGGLFYLYAAYIGVFHRFSSHSADFHQNFILLLYHKMQNCSSSSCNFS